MRIATWNVNSVRTRLDQVVAWLQQERPEVLCLQETKVTDELFPREAFEALGYQVVISGQRPTTASPCSACCPSTTCRSALRPCFPAIQKPQA